MKITSVSLEGFGTFNKKFTAKLEENKINLIQGNNESGKSTFLKGILSTLFGLKKNDWERLKSWGKSKNYIGEIKFSLNGNQYWITRDFESNKVTLIKQDAENNIETVFEGNAAPQSRTEEKEFYLSKLKEIIGINNEDVFYNTNVILQRSIESKISGEIQQIITGAIGSNYKNILEKWRDGYFTVTRKSSWDDAADKRNDRKIESLEKDLAELQEKKEAIIESSVKSNELEKKLDGIEKIRKEKEEELRTAKMNLVSVKKYTDIAKEYNSMLNRNNELRKELDKIKEIEAELKSKQKIIQEEYNGFNNITDEVFESYKEIKKLKKELEEKDKKFDDIPKHKEPSNIKRMILGINGIVIAGLMALIGLKFKLLPLSFIIAGITALISILFLLISFIKHYQLKIQHKTILTVQQTEIEGLKQKLMMLNNNINEHSSILEDENFEYKYEQYKKIASAVENLNFTLDKMKDIDDLKKEQDKIENKIEVLGWTLYDLESKNPFLSDFKDNPEKGLKYVNRLNEQIDKLEGKVEKMKTSEFEIKQELAATFTERDSVESIEDRIEELEEELSKYKFQKNYYIESINTLNEAILEYQEKHKERLSKSISEIYSQITEGKYIDIQLTDNFDPVIKFKDNRIVDIDNLSCGAEEQLYFAIRLALIKEINNISNLPLLLDDPFVNFDQERLEVARSILYNIMGDNQVILFSHFKSYAGWNDINLIKLS